MINKFNRTLKLFSLLLFLFSSVHIYPKDKVEELGTTIDALISDLNCTVSIQIASADKYDLIYEHNPRAGVIPASITKLVTAAAAFDLLGLSYDFKTIVYSDDNDVKDGIVNGNLYLKGYGDPDLNSGDISELAKKVSDLGIKEITGNIIYDESYLDDEHYSLANYYQGDTHKNYWPYISALSFNKNGGGYDPASSAASYLSDELKANSIIVGGIVVSGVTPQAAKEVAETSHSFFNVIANMNKESDNQSAITVFKVLGAKYLTPPGTISKGEDAVISFLTGMGNPRNHFEILEGSGLSRFNTVNSDLYVRLLKYMYDDVKAFDYFYNSLAVAGVDGTLRNRMIGTEAEKNVHAKTGTLNSVSSLAGYAVSRDSELLIFYIAMNGFSGSANGIRNRQDLICEELCKFSRK